MMKLKREGFKELTRSAIAVLALSGLVCGIYPASVWILARIVFPVRANGSLVVRDGKSEGSILIGRPFSGPDDFHPRPSAAGAGYDALRSGGSNLGPTSRTLAEQIRRRAAEYRAENGLGPLDLVPADAVTASGSGLDPHISVRNALLQAVRVAKSRGLSEADVVRLVKAAIEGRDLGIFGEPRVNVLRLNLALEGRQP